MLPRELRLLGLDSSARLMAGATSSRARQPTIASSHRVALRWAMGVACNGISVRRGRHGAPPDSLRAAWSAARFLEGGMERRPIPFWRHGAPPDSFLAALERRPIPFSRRLSSSVQERFEAVPGCSRVEL